MTRLAGIILSMVMLFGSGLMADSDEMRYIVVSGDGEMVADADQISFSFTIQTRDQELDEAKKTNDNKLEKVKEVFKLFSVSNKDVDISNFSVRPIYDYDDGDPEMISAFNISRHVRVTLKNVDDYEPLMDALIGAEIFKIGGLAYEISDPAALHKHARENALKKARDKAEGMARYYGLKLGKVISIDESRGFFRYGSPNANIMAGDISSQADESFKGRKTITAHVVVKFELTD